MCGITAILSKSDAFSFLFNSLTSLQNRGYDSAGVCCIDPNNEFRVHKKASQKNASALDLLKMEQDMFAQCHIGIAHTRWATHGEKNDTNAHPHICYRDTIALVHNGIIDNYNEIKDFLRTHGIECKSATDSEVVVNLISHFNTSQDMQAAIQSACGMLHGTWALVILNKYENTIYATRHSAPLIMAICDDKIILTSETCGFINEADHYMPIKEGEVYSIQKDFAPTNMTKKQLSYTNIELSPYPFSHWTLKEIHEQANTVKTAMNMGDRFDGTSRVKLGGLEHMKDELLECKSAYILGCGTSFYSGQIGEFLMNKLGVFDKVRCVDAAEFDTEWIKRGEKTLIIMVSQSGETKDLHKCIEMIRDNPDVVTLGVINVVDSLISQETDCGVYVNAGREVGVASTKSFTSQVLIQTLITLWFHQYRFPELEQVRKEYIRDMKHFVADTETVLEQLSKVDFKTIATEMINTSLFVLGTGVNVPVANEGALKIKELSYIHAEGYSYSSLKHGPLALIDRGTPAIFLISNKNHTHKLNNSMMEVKSRLGRTFVIGNQEDADVPILSDNHFAFLWNNIAVQMIAFNIALAKGNDPDMPRNLAKVVTVL